MRHVEVGVKTEPRPGVTANLTVFHTGIEDYQTQVVNAQVGVLRGYLANAEKVRVRGAEFDGNARIGRRLSLYGAARLHRRHLRLVPGCAAAARGDRRAAGQGHLRLGAAGHLEVGAHLRRRVQQAGDCLRPGRRVLCGASTPAIAPTFSSSPSASRYMVVDGYGLINARAGFRWSDGWSVFLWSRNLLDKEYFEFLTAQPGNSGLYVGLPGDPRTVGVTLRMNLRSIK